MAPGLSHTTSPNRLLSRLSADDFGLLEPHLVSVDLPLRQMLAARNKSIEHCYFLEHGFASVVANGAGEHPIEIGIIGREGMTGLPVILEIDRSPHDVFMQLAGDAQRISSEHMLQALGQSLTLRRGLQHYVHAFLVQTAYTAVANGRSKLEERLARWLLMAHDRVGGSELKLTHEFLAVMLGVRRPDVTVAVNLLEQKGLISANRGVITIIDREGLEQTSNGAYGQAEAEFNRLFG